MKTKPHQPRAARSQQPTSILEQFLSARASSRTLHSECQSARHSDVKSGTLTRASASTILYRDTLDIRLKTKGAQVIMSAFEIFR